MIKSNELRIGNYVLLNGKIIKITDAEIIDYIVKSENGRLRITPPIHKIDPIPLTPEIMFKFGFEKVDIPDSINEEGEIIKGYNNWELINSNFCFTRGHNDEIISGNKAELKYLHQLQNLYFAKTYEELEIKEIIISKK